MIGPIALEGHEPGREDDPVWLVPPSPLDHLEFPGGLDQARLEDMQMWSFLGLLTARGGMHPISVRAVAEGQDPPDRFLVISEEEWAVELTELTIGQVRAGLAQARSFGRELETNLHREANDLGHLRGRRVLLSLLNDKAPKRSEYEGVTTSLIEALREDKGFVGEGHDFRQGLPEQMALNGIYGDVGPFHVQVESEPGLPDQISVTASAQAEISKTEIQDALEKLIMKKDDPRNEVLLISCGLPDPAGYLCPLDLFLFSLVAENLDQISGALGSPEHLKAVVLHSPQARHFVEIFRSADDGMPWDDKDRNGPVAQN